MTDQSRVEAVARAIDKVWESNFEAARDSYIPQHLLDAMAQAAIEANDAWLKGQADGVARILYETEKKSLGLSIPPQDWKHRREMKSEQWAVAMFKAKAAIAAVTSLPPKEPDQ